MKYYVVLIAAIIFFSCKKSNYDKYAAGSEKRMTVTTHDITIQGTIADGENSPFVTVDLDGDKVADVKFVSYKDTVDVGPEYEVWGVTLEIVNSFFDVLEIPNSGDSYYTETPYYIEPGWGPPRPTRTLTTGCESEGSVFYGNSPNNPKTFTECAGFQPEQLDWLTNDFGYLDLVTSGYTYTTCHFNETNDSLLCDIRVNEPTCYPIPTDEKAYLIFRKLESTECYSVGWIEVLLTDENKLEIKRSAISNKPLEF